MDEDVRTVWCGNLSDRVTEELLYELFLQGGPVQRVTIPRDRMGKQRPYGFVIYKHVDSVCYALKLFDGTELFNRRLNLSSKNGLASPQSVEPRLDRPNEIVQLNEQFSIVPNWLPFELGAFTLGVPPAMMFANANLLPTQQLVERHSFKDDRRERSAHPYYRKKDEFEHKHRESRDRVSRSSYDSRNDSYSRRNNYRPSSSRNRHNRY